jgi:hypothetical protein
VGAAKPKLARATIAPQNPCMRQIFPIAAFLLFILVAAPFALRARADGVLYRCESDAGISIQGTPCPKGSAQRRIAVQSPTSATPTPAPTPAQTPAAPAPAPAMPITPSSAMHGPNDPYPLWQCMRADGSTFDSRTGIPGKQWVLKAEAPDVMADASLAPNIAAPLKKGQHSVRPYVDPGVAAGTDKGDASEVDSTPSPPGAAPGQWVADQCTQLDSQHACDRFATRRDALRKQIYAAKPSERATYAPEEQDLTSMLYAACGR